MAVQHYFFWFLEWYDPREGIDLVEDKWTAEQFKQVSTFLSKSVKLMNQEVAREKRDMAH
jgi:hypothetical protein